MNISLEALFSDIEQIYLPFTIFHLQLLSPPWQGKIARFPSGCT